MKIYGRFFLITLLFVLLLASSIVLAGPKDTPPDQVATVNGSVITRKVFDREIKLYEDRAAREGKQLSGEQLSAAKSAVLDRLVESELLYQESRKKNVRVEAQSIEDRLKEIKQRFPSEAEFKNALERMNITETEIKSQIEKGIAINSLVETQVTDKIVISEKESKDFYDSNPQFFKQGEQVKASHILIKVAPDANESQKAEARKKIETIQKKLNSGEDFGAMAREFSEGPSRERSGDLGYFGRGQMVKSFDAVAFELKPGQVSEIVETQFGYHLIKVYEKKPAKTMAYSEVKEQINQHLKQQKARQQVERYVNGLKKEAKIEKFL